jgi:hypothetical protein
MRNVLTIFALPTPAAAIEIPSPRCFVAILIRTAGGVATGTVDPDIVATDRVRC